MTKSSWRDSVVTYIGQEAQPADKFGHQPRLYALATRIGKGMDYDDDILFAAAWMHDLGVFLGHRPNDSSVMRMKNLVLFACLALICWGCSSATTSTPSEAIQVKARKEAKG